MNELQFPNLLDRLIDAHTKYGSIIIAVDYDDTIFDYTAPNNTGDYVFNLVLKCKQLAKSRVILFTCREGLALDAAISSAKGKGLTFDAVNENLPEVVLGYVTRKPFYNVLLDDRSGLKETCEVLERFLEKVKND